MLSTSLILHILIFQSSCEYTKVQAQLVVLLGPHGTNSRIPVTPIASFAANTNTEAAYKQFCNDLSQPRHTEKCTRVLTLKKKKKNDLSQLGVTENIIWQKEDKIREILKSQGMVGRSQIDDNNVGDQDQLETAYQELCKELYQIGITKDLIPPKDRVLGILRSRRMVASGQSDGSDIGDTGQLPEQVFHFLHPSNH